MENNENLNENKITFEACYDQNKKVISVDGQGQADIKFTTDATQLASVLSSLAKFTGQLFKVTLEPVEKISPVYPETEEENGNENKDRTKTFKG